MNAESNRNHFDTIASQYDDRPGAARVAKVIANAVMKEYDFDDESTVLMEYACGTGKSYTSYLLPSLMKIQALFLVNYVHLSNRLSE